MRIIENLHIEEVIVPYPYKFNIDQEDNFEAVFTILEYDSNNQGVLTYRVIGEFSNAIASINGKNYYIPCFSFDFENNLTGTKPLKSSFKMANRVMATIASIMKYIADKYEPHGFVFDAASRKLDTLYSRMLKNLTSTTSYVYSPDFPSEDVYGEDHKITYILINRDYLKSIHQGKQKEYELEEGITSNTPKLPYKYTRKNGKKFFADIIVTPEGTGEPIKFTVQGKRFEDEYFWRNNWGNNYYDLTGLNILFKNDLTIMEPLGSLGIKIPMMLMATIFEIIRDYTDIYFVDAFIFHADSKPLVSFYKHLLKGLEGYQWQYHEDKGDYFIAISDDYVKEFQDNDRASQKEGVTPRTPKLPYQLFDVCKYGFNADFTIPADLTESGKDIDYGVIGEVIPFKIGKDRKVKMLRLDFLNRDTDMKPLHMDFKVGMYAISTVIAITNDYIDQYPPDGIMFNPSHKKLIAYYKHQLRSVSSISNYVYHPELRYKPPQAEFNSFILLKK